ncbi:MAG: hypothetical protein JSU64_09010 [candidate division WOR-3 bacterium]|nr:MAG: hypothetical protein JSU64_09010 [candidate division WOR-3 bacterium]
MKILIYEDNYDKFYPLVNLFPQFQLRAGICTVAENSISHFGNVRADFVARKVFGLEKAKPSAPALYLSSRLLLTSSFRVPSVDSLISVNGQTVGFIRTRAPFPASLDEIRDMIGTIGRSITVEGLVLNNLWDMVTVNADVIIKQCTRIRGPGKRSVGVVAKSRNVYVAPGAKVHKMVHLDGSDGPVYIDKGAQIRPFTTIIGPSFVGAHAIVDRAKIIRSSIGPHCRIGGEVEESIFGGFSNKYHEGFIGHSYVGEWVNLGALTTNSDLKNNYGPVRIKIGENEIDTGITKLGCFIGDHVKLGIGTLIPTGAVIGSFVNFAGGGLIPRYVPDFKWVVGSGEEAYDLNKAIKTAQIVLGRRNVQMSRQYEEIIRNLHGQVCRSN